MFPFFNKSCVVWPHRHGLEIFLDTQENNIISLDINLWDLLSPEQLSQLATVIKSHRINSLSVLVGDDIVITKSFVYDSKIDSIDKGEILKLAGDIADFPVDVESVDYKLFPQNDKTIIQASFSNLPLLNNLRQNLSSLDIKVDTLKTVSDAIAIAINSFYQSEYFLLYPTSQSELVLMLASGTSVYLTSLLKKSSLNIQKLVNYSKLYFSKTVEKIYLPTSHTIDITSTTVLDKTFYDTVQIANTLNLPSNLPLPVIGLLLATRHQTVAIIKPTMPDITPPIIPAQSSSSKNILPIVAVFVVTAAIASIAIWYVLNRNSNPTLENPVGQTPSPVAQLPTSTPIPTVPSIDKSIKIQVLNATDINGQAATLKASLSSMGFTDVTVGNSKEKSTANEIRIKPSLETSKEYFSTQLATSFPATVSASLKETSTYDAVFVIGTKLSAPAETP